jgi:hypothetical protein
LPLQMRSSDADFRCVWPVASCQPAQVCASADAIWLLTGAGTWRSTIS